MQKVFFTGALVAVGIIVSGCGGGTSGGIGNAAPIPVAKNIPAPVSTNPPQVTPTSPPSSAPTSTGFAGDAKQAQINGKTIFVDAKTGLALYEFRGDSTNQSNCTGSCLAIWPAHAAATSEKSSSNFSIFTRSDGSLQWAYKGHPLYTFVSDTVSNNATGNGIQDFSLATP